MGRKKEGGRKKHKSGALDERILYYADLCDLWSIIDKNWTKFEKIFGKKKKIQALIEIVGDFRNSDSHRRELLPYQKNLVVGVCGEIRNSIVRYRSKKDRPEDYFPKIEFVRDSLGNKWLPGQFISVHTEMSLRVGDEIEYTITATDPMGEDLKYSVNEKNWTSKNTIFYKFSTTDIGKNASVTIFIKSKRTYHASGFFDDFVRFVYHVLPKK